MIDEIIAVGDPAHVAHHVALAQATNSSKATKYPERYGALGDGVNDDTGPINAALADLQTGETLYFESGKTYLHSGELTVTVDGVTLRGGGTLLATTPDNACVRVDADDVTVEGLTLKLKPVEQTTLSGSLTSGTTAVVLASDAGFPVGTGWTILVDPETASAERMLVTARTGPNLTVTRAQNNSTAKAHADGAVVVRATRQSDSEAHLLYSNGHSGMRARNVIFHSSDASASLLEACSNYSYEGCKVYGGLADSFHNTHGSHDGLYRNCEAWYGGDDSYAVIGYEGQGKPFNITFESCKSVGGFARGFAVVGADDVVVRDGYVEGSVDKPTCYSNDGVAPEADAQLPQAKKCATCVHNQWGSKVSEAGKKLKACSDSRRLAVATVDTPTDPMLLRVPAASMKNLEEYGKMLAARGLPPQAVVTKVGFDYNVAYPALTFKPVGLIGDPATLSEIKRMREEDIVLQIVGLTPTEGTAAAEDSAEETPAAAPAPVPAPAAKKVAAKPAPAPAPAPVEKTVDTTSALEDDISAMLSNLDFDN